jgi:hypothetical protein
LLATGLRRCVEGLFFAVVLGPDHDFAVAARRDGRQRGKVDGHGHDKALGVIGVFADQVDAARSDKDRWGGVEAGDMFFAQNSGIMHGITSFFSGRWSVVSDQWSVTADHC